MEGQRERARAASAFETKKAAGFQYASESVRARLESMPDRVRRVRNDRGEGRACRSGL